MISLTKKGLYCRAGNFHIDPRSGVDHAVITHAHSDHARRGSVRYYCTTTGLELLRSRIGKKINVEAFPYGQTFFINDVALSFHPAGHILGSAQVRMAFRGKVWVASGDYKRDPDPTCAAFESVACDVFITEATFGTPTFAWNKNADIGREIFEWWQKNAARGVNSLLFAYSLGKAQRILGELYPHAKREVLCHPAVSELNLCYRAQGVNLAPTRCLSAVESRESLRGELFLAPHSFIEGRQAHLLGENYETAFASGWMLKRRPGFDLGYTQGFVVSDHADWNDLVRTIQETKARRVYVQHRGKGALVKYLRGLGLEAFPDTALEPKDPDQLPLF